MIENVNILKTCTLAIQCIDVCDPRGNDVEDVWCNPPNVKCIGAE